MIVMDATRAVALLAERQFGVISRPQAIRCGLTSSAIGRRVETGDWERLHQGVYRLGGSLRGIDQGIQAACLAAGRPVLASHTSAAHLLHLPLEDPEVEVSIAVGRGIALKGVRVHRTRSLPRTDTLVVRGIPTTSVARTLIDLASVLPREKLDDLLDHVLANRLIPIGYLRKRLRALGSGRDGAASLTALLRQRPTGRRPRQSDAERELLQALRAADVLLPSTQVPIRLQSGAVAYPDLCYPEQRLIVEVDSYLHHSSLAKWEEDHLRNQSLVALRWRILPVTASEIRRNPAATAEKVRSALGGG